MDYALEQAINGPAGHHAFWDAFMRDAATWAVPVFAGAVALWFLVGWLRGQSHERRGALTALLAAGGALLANQAILLLWDRPRPFDAHAATVTTLVTRSGDPSFPSDHAAAAAAIAVVVFLAHRRLGVLALLAAALTCLARVYVGAHYPGDVVGGAAVGVGVAALLWWPLAPVTARLSRLVDRSMRLLRLPLPDRSAADLDGRRVTS